MFLDFPQNKTIPVGADLIATDIRRAREVNLASYPELVKQILGLEITSWDDLYAANLTDEKVYYTYLQYDIIILGGLWAIKPFSLRPREIYCDVTVWHTSHTYSS